MVAPDLDLDGFIHSSGPAGGQVFANRMIAVLAAVAAVLGALVFWYVRINRRLQREIAKRAEAQRELEKLDGQKSLLLSIVGHDLRSAFNILLCYGELLVDDGAKMDRQRRAGIHLSIRDSARAAYTLLSNLLEWASMQSGAGKVTASTVAVAPLIEHVVALLAPQAAAKNVEIRVGETDGPTVHADPRMTETILRNLLGNAVKFTPSGGSVTVGVRRREMETEVTVADTGVGIPPERLERLFQVEPKSPAAGTAGEQGSGLGLVLCRDLAAANQGSLKIDSGAGIGTRVSLWLPAGRAA